MTEIGVGQIARETCVIARRAPLADFPIRRAPSRRLCRSDARRSFQPGITGLVKRGLLACDCEEVVDSILGLEGGVPAFLMNLQIQ
jgi:hypothetical protein